MWGIKPKEVNDWEIIRKSPLFWGLIIPIFLLVTSIGSLLFVHWILWVSISPSPYADIGGGVIALFLFLLYGWFGLLASILVGGLLFCYILLRTILFRRRFFSIPQRGYAVLVTSGIIFLLLGMLLPMGSQILESSIMESFNSVCEKDRLVTQQFYLNETFSQEVGQLEFQGDQVYWFILAVNNQELLNKNFSLLIEFTNVSSGEIIENMYGYTKIKYLKSIELLPNETNDYHYIHSTAFFAFDDIPTMLININCTISNYYTPFSSPSVQLLFVHDPEGTIKIGISRIQQFDFIVSYGFFIFLSGSIILTENLILLLQERFLSNTD